MLSVLMTGEVEPNAAGGASEADQIATETAGLPEGVRVFADRELCQIARRTLTKAALVFAEEDCASGPAWEEGFRKVIGGEEADGAVSPAVEVGVTFTNDVGIRTINRQYREVDSATDVLSFPQFSREEAGSVGPGGIPENPIMLGDIIVSLPTALRQAQEYGHSRERELGYLLVHGFLHLVGHDHEDEAERKAMRDLEERILGEVGLER